MSIDNSITATRVIMGIKNALADWAPSSIICHIFTAAKCVAELVPVLWKRMSFHFNDFIKVH